MWDNHVHITANEYATTWKDELHRASLAGVTNIVAVAENAIDGYQLLKLQAEHQDSDSHLKLHSCIGLHPWQADRQKLVAVLDALQLHKGAIVGVGEIGLDYMPKTLGQTPDEIKLIQEECFKAQLSFAVENDLPVNVHSSCAGHYTIAMMEQCQVKTAVLHAFDGKVKYAELAHKLGYKLSVPACVVRSPSLQKMVKRLPLDALLLETDSPALAPVKQTTNHPANVALAAEEIAKLHGTSVENVRTTTSATAAALWLNSV
eukprot:TRINITY_DN7686_c0_g1_i1.p1 TRINITY_DN7686_c0_g1~~TRINITY_DN7686_c0_g1_i1.p1  ORF type:complete len:261 (+),score=31.62 TRINITY_DN7686_c0_g1_i1:885-1667(+)